MPFLLLQAQAGISDEEFYNLLAWGGAVVFIVILLFIVNRILSITTRNRVRGMPTPLAMSGDDLDKLKEKGQLSEEEAKKVRAAMAKKFLERAQEEEKKHSMKAGGEAALHAEEERVRASLDAALGKEPSPRQAPETPQPTAEPKPAAGRPSLQRMPVPPRSPIDDLPENLRPMVRLSEFELDELRASGFLSPEDIDRIRAARED